MQPALRVLQDHDGTGPLLQLTVATRLQQGSRHPRHRQLQRAVIGAAQQGMQVARIAQCHGAIDDVALTARLVLDGGQGVEVVIHQLAHRLQRLFELRLADPLGFVDQLVRQLAQAMLGEISHCNVSTPLRAVRASRSRNTGFMVMSMQTSSWVLAMGRLLPTPSRKS